MLSNSSLQTQSTAGHNKKHGFVLTEELHTTLSVINVVVSLLGTVANSINIVVFEKLGMKDTINITLLGLGISDFMVCFVTLLSAIFDIPSIRDEVSRRWDIGVIEMNYMVFMIPLVFFARITIVLTAFITVERCLCVAMPLKVKTILTRSRVKTVVVAAFPLVGFWMVPSYYMHRFGWRFNFYTNRTILGMVLADDYDLINAWYTPMDAVIFYVILYTLIISSTATLIVNLKKKLSWRRKAIADSSNSKENDKTETSTSTKEKRIAKMVVTISLVFIVSYLPSVVVWIVKTLDQEFRLHGSKADVLIVCGLFSFFTQVVNSSSNLLIYYKNSSNFREMLDKVFFKVEIPGKSYNNR